MLQMRILKKISCPRPLRTSFATFLILTNKIRTTHNNNISLKWRKVNTFSLTEAFLDKSFHALRTAFDRESKKYKEREPKKKCKLFDQLFFLMEEMEKVENKVNFELEEKEMLIDIFNSYSHFMVS